MEDKSAPTPSKGSGPASTDDGLVVLSYILSGILFYGGLGWAGAHYLGHRWMLPAGLILGLLASVYLVVKRYGSPTR
ncbi:hypothetical protein [Aestuariimicrobium ganziense]|uniref:hypothetical protein n=1 Tax=Aestuariimicrobium ganziense TaxID=2773677 RepID=UPI0019457595|nr:hypothetical protein [Aestuariimicrobium ganziense]